MNHDLTRDWLLTLLATSPLLLAATIVVLALTRKPTRNERVRHAAEASAPPAQSRSAGGRE